MWRWRSGPTGDLRPPLCFHRSAARLAAPVVWEGATAGFQGGNMAAERLVLPHYFAWANVQSALWQRQSALGQRRSATWQGRSATGQIEVAIAQIHSTRRPDGGQQSPGRGAPRPRAQVCPQPRKEGLVSDAREWPSVPAIRPLLTGEPVVGTWFDRTQEYAARRQ
jgi:hypothetical protein